MRNAGAIIPSVRAETTLRQVGRRVAIGEIGAPSLLALLAFALRLYRVEAPSLWFDDTHSVHMAGLGLAQLIAEVSADIHPPLYFVALGWWMRFAGGSEFALRYFTLAAGTLAVPLLFVLGRRVGGRRLGLAAAATVALSPLLVYYAQEVRMYAPSVTLVTAVAFFAWRGMAGERPRRWVAQYVLLAAAAGYTHLFNLAVVAMLNVAYAALALWPAVSAGPEELGDERATGEGRSAGERRSRPALGRTAWWLGAQVGVGALLLPWLPVLQSKGLVGAAARWQPLDELGIALRHLGMSFTVGISPAPGGQYPLTLAVWGLAALGLVGPVALRGRRLTFPGAGRAALLGGLWLGACFFLVFLSLAGRREAVPRYLMVAYPGFALLVGTGLALFLRTRPALLGGLALLGIAFAPPLADYLRDP